ncbi:fumarate reductase/succinate dehydrogenase flavoprotein subunit [Actinocorallia sp. A-T 12471]|uniref:fumarate reductase/succinate dehydrogenase flavoprotein subunit n=1 Tax=Actinocorallia sp. A-T 12471 TaxID=3089813 RepID=UPI0029D29912|nr:fumarate reductase/succinate dehydrogenase flavoprotein subunit [Actinocorallia sp. A-T 12471]MDX6742219.1 fumarate reductase/succinate dehydrogenase flavoprotein subunit [Actinocorallia sp. A-T 12471]
MEIPELADRTELTCDVLVVGGGTAGTMAAIAAAENGASVLLLEKAHVRHSGALAMGMDGVNNAVIPGVADPEDYVAEITRANDGIVNQRTVHQTATRGYAMVKRLEGYGVKFEKDEHGQYAVRRVHRSGAYVLPMPEGKDVKKVLYRVLRRRDMRERVRIENRVMPVRVLTSEGRAVGAAGFNTRTGEFVVVRAGAVVLATGPCGRLGLPASGYLYGTYENPANAGDGYAMAYHAGAELSGLECFQINPLIKDYNGPACAYVANPFGGYQVNAAGDRFVDCDYWSGQMMAEVKREIDSARGPIYLKTTHLPDETLTRLEGILHTTERPTRGTFHAGRGHDYRTHDVEMHISEIGLCGGHSASGVWVDEHARTTVPGLYAAGDLACVPHNYMIGAFVFGELAGADAAASFRHGEPDEAQIAAAHELVYRPLRHPDGPPQQQVEYKLRRFVNDYVAPPKTGTRLELALEAFTRMSAEIAGMGGRTPHELMRCVEVSFIRDCAELAARSSLVRTESRWGLYHDRADLPGRDDAAWFAHLNVRRAADGGMEFVRVPVRDYLVEVEGFVPPGGERTVIDRFAPTEFTPSGHVPAGGRAPAAARSPRILELLALAETSPGVDAFAPYLADADPKVRRAAVATLTETVPEGFAPVLAGALDDGHASVRHAAATALRELVEVIPPTPALAAALRAEHADPVARAACLDVLRALRLGDIAHFTRALADPDQRVRLQAVRGLVSLDATDAVAKAVGDPAREVRITAAAGLGHLAAPEGTAPLSALAADHDPLVRAAALKALASYDGAPALSVPALSDPSWEVRSAAASALAAAPAHGSDLARALADPHLDVRKAAVIALAAHPPAASRDAALTDALEDPDADVRAYARRGLASEAGAGR